MPAFASFADRLASAYDDNARRRQRRLANDVAVQEMLGRFRNRIAAGQQAASPMTAAMAQAPAGPPNPLDTLPEGPARRAVEAAAQSFYPHPFTGAAKPYATDAASNGWFQDQRGKWTRYNPAEYNLSSPEYARTGIAPKFGHVSIKMGPGRSSLPTDASGSPLPLDLDRVKLIGDVIDSGRPIDQNQIASSDPAVRMAWVAAFKQRGLPVPEGWQGSTASSPMATALTHGDPALAAQVRADRKAAEAARWDKVRQKAESASLGRQFRQNGPLPTLLARDPNLSSPIGQAMVFGPEAVAQAQMMREKNASLERIATGEAKSRAQIALSEAADRRRVLEAQTAKEQRDASLAADPWINYQKYLSGFQDPSMALDYPDWLETNGSALSAFGQRLALGPTAVPNTSPQREPAVSPRPGWQRIVGGMKDKKELSDILDRLADLGADSYSPDEIKKITNRLKQTGVLENELAGLYPGNVRMWDSPETVRLKKSRRRLLDAMLNRQPFKSVMFPSSD